MMNPQGCMCGASCPCSGSGACSITIGLVFLLWFLVSSGLLYYTWNKVINALFSAKTMKFWHALLLVGTISFLCAPKYIHKNLKHKGCHKSKMCPNKHMNQESSDYSSMPSSGN